MALLFHDGKEAHLILKTDVKVNGGKLPQEVAWVLPIPSLPSKYEEVDPAVFTELDNLFPAVPQWRGSPKHTDNSSNLKEKAIVVHDLKVVGNYQIQPIEINKDGAAEVFNSWLRKNHFNPMPDSLQKIYLKKGAIFLAIRAKTDGSQMHFKPLHIVYSSPNLSFPLKFTHDTRTFNLQLYVMTPKPLPRLFLKDSYLLDNGEISISPTNSTPELKKILGNQSGTIQRFQASELNGPGKELKKLRADPQVPVGVSP